MQNKSRSWFLLIVLSIVWGSSFILMKRGLDTYSSDEVAALRIGIAFLFLSPLLWKYRKLEVKKYWPALAVMGFFGNLFPAFLFTAAETEISSSLTGMLNALTPLFTVIIGAVWLKTKPNGSQLSGLIIGFVAAVALMYFDTNNSPSKNATYGLLVVAATLCYALSITTIRKYLSGVDPVAATTWACAFTGPPSLIYLFVKTDFVEHTSSGSLAGNSLIYISILAIVGTALSVIAFNYLIREAGAVFASTCTYLIPVVAIVWGLVDYEKINGFQLSSIAVIIGSVYLINRR
jgi:drug/metabolite transporter (DMT)-like permease